jgi:hypothetical protein
MAGPASRSVKPARSLLYLTYVAPVHQKERKSLMALKNPTTQRRKVRGRFRKEILLKRASFPDQTSFDDMGSSLPSLDGSK